MENGGDIFSVFHVGAILSVANCVGEATVPLRTTHAMPKTTELAAGVMDGNTICDVLAVPALDFTSNAWVPATSKKYTPKLEALATVIVALDSPAVAL